MFKNFDPAQGKMLQVMDNDGKIIHPEFLPANIDDSRILKAYKDMLFVRTADFMAVSYQRQGRMFTYPPNYGQEAISGGMSIVMRENDWMVPAFRELGAWLSKGVSLRDIFLYFMGNEDGAAFKGGNHIVPISVPIGTQIPHAAGIGFEINFNQKDEVVFAVIGDGGTSEGDFHEGLNFAAVWKSPVVYIVQNNQFAISVPFKMQTASQNIAVKSVAYGIPGILVDGNDLFAMTTALQWAQEHAKSGKGPVLIEALTYRKGAHTTSDDPTKYRTKEEEEKWDCTDPLKRLKAYLTSKKLWTEEEEAKIVEEFKAEIDRQFEAAENYKPYPYEDIFDYMYVEMPDDLKAQKVEFEKFLKWKEAKQ